ASGHRVSVGDGPRSPAGQLQHVIVGEAGAGVPMVGLSPRVPNVGMADDAGEVTVTRGAAPELVGRGAPESHPVSGRGHGQAVRQSGELVGPRQPAPPCERGSAGQRYVVAVSVTRWHRGPRYERVVIGSDAGPVP